MTKLNFGTRNQIHFDTRNEMYETLGFLAKSDGTTKLVWEPNEDSGAWGSEGRIQCYKNTSSFPVALRKVFTAGNGNILFRINCNEFIQELASEHNFVLGFEQNIEEIKETIPKDYINDFEKGIKI